MKPAGPLTTAETRHVHNYLLFRRQIHDGPLYTQRPAPHDPTRPRRVYDQHQRNSQYVYRSKANTDLFTGGVETYSSRFKARERTLPDLSTRPYVKRLFPPELRPTLDDAEGKKKGGEGKKLKLSSVTALPTAEEVFRLGGEEALKKLELGHLEEGQEGAEEEEEVVEEEDEDYAYDDEDAGDYDAEAYFEDGDEEGDDGDDGGDDGGYY